MRYLKVLSVAGCLLASSQLAAHGGEDHADEKAAPAAVTLPGDRFVAQSGLVEAVLVANAGRAELDLYLSEQPSNAPLQAAGVDVSGLTLAAPVQAISAGHYRLALSAPLGNEPQLLALTVSATVDSQPVLELLDLTFTAPGTAPDIAQAGAPHGPAGFAGLAPANSLRGLFMAAVAGLFTGLGLALYLLRRPRLAQAGAR